MRPEDGKWRGGWQPPKLSLNLFSFITPSSSSQSQDLNLATIERQELLLYAFLDSVEWEAAQAAGEGPLKVGGSLEGTGLGQYPILDWGGSGEQEAPSSIDYGDEEADNSDLEETEKRPQRLVTARLDCVATRYFNDNFMRFADFYKKYHDVGMEEGHDLSRPVEHDAAQTEEHIKLINGFHGEGKSFCTVYVTFLATPENMAAFERMFDSEGWAGLGVIDGQDKLGLPIAVYPPDADESEPPPVVWTLRSIYELTEARRNSLRRVFGLDFASDGHFPEESGPVPVEPPKTPVPVFGESKWRKKLGGSSKTRQDTPGVSVRMSFKKKRMKGRYTSGVVIDIDVLLLAKQSTYLVPTNGQEELLKLLFLRAGLGSKRAYMGPKGWRKRLPLLIK